MFTEETPAAKPSPSGKMAGWNKYTDDMARQGFIVSRNYTHMSSDPYHKLGCPGCQPDKCVAEDLVVWRAIEAHWHARGDVPSCDIERQAWFTERNRGKPWWNEARDSVLHYNPRRAHGLVG